MYPALHDDLVRDTDQLRILLEQHSTETIVGMTNAMLMRWFGHDPEPSPLVSPMRQVFFMLGIMLTTPEPAKPWSFGDIAFARAVALLNSIFHKYSLMYWPESAPLASMPPEWKAIREVAMLTFLYYFNTMLTASIEQVRDRVRRYLCPFDAEFLAILGISASGALAATDWLARQFQRGADTMVDFANAELHARRRLLDQAEAHGWDLDRLRRQATEGAYAQTSADLIQSLSSFMKVDPRLMQAELGTDSADAYWKRFVSVRGTTTTFTYLTELNPAEDRPLICLPDGRAMCPSPNVLYTAVLEGLERDILASPNRVRFLSHRDGALEEEATTQFNRLFPPESIFRNLFETQDLQNEHDLIALCDKTLLIVECKAATPREPLRDPEKAFVRIRDDFRSKRGIQGAFDQATGLLSTLNTAGRLRLFDSRRKEVLTLDKRNIARTYVACITRDTYGPLAVDLSLLLEKPPSAPYPWSIGILDLTYMIDAWTYFRLGLDEFLSFLDQRAALHGKVTTSDELELVGFYLEHGSLSPLFNLEADHVTLSIDYSDILDKVYAVTLGGSPPTLSPKEPQIRFVGPRVAIVSPPKPTHAA